MRVGAYHRSKQKKYSTIVGNFINRNFNPIGRFSFEDTTTVYEHLALYTRKRTEDFFGLKGEDFDEAVAEFKQLYKAYGGLTKNTHYQDIIKATTFGYQLSKDLSQLQVLNSLTAKLAVLKEESKLVQPNGKQVNNQVATLGELINSAENFKKALIASARDAKKKQKVKSPNKQFKFRNFYLNSYFGSVVKMAGTSAEIVGLQSLDNHITTPLFELTKAKIVGTEKLSEQITRQEKKINFEYTSKGDISFDLSIKGETAKAVFGSVKLRKGKTKEFTAVKGTSLSAVPGNPKFKTDFTNLFLSINMASDKQLKFLTSLIIDFALIGVFNRPIYFLTLTPTDATVNFFYEMYEQYAKGTSGGHPYIKRTAGYLYKKGESSYVQPPGGENYILTGRNFYKDIRYTGGRLEKFTKYANEGYMTIEYAMKKTDITNLVVMGKFI